MTPEQPSAPRKQSRLTAYLVTAPTPVFAAFAIVSAFSTYFCMYAFRKPWAAATFRIAEEGVKPENWAAMKFWDTNMDLKVALVISQTIGYALSKFIGIKICSEVPRRHRALLLVALIFLAQAALLLFAVVPPNWKWAAIFLNGIPLGMVWGLVVWFLEGRRVSEILLAGLSCSYIMASGIVKDVGGYMMTNLHVNQFWMPFATGAVFLLPFLLSVFLMNQIPQPDDEDVDQRVEREPMDREHRWAFVRKFLPGLILLIVAYFFLTAYRGFRDDFGKEIFIDLGYGEKPDVFTVSETVVGFGVMIPLALIFLVRNNRRGVIAAFAVMITGLLLLAGGTLLLDAGRIDGLTWMITVGIGAYLAYVPIGSVLFDRLIASTRVIGTAVLAIYIADAFGYVGSISVLLYKERFDHSEMSWLEFFRGFTYFMSALGVVMFIAALASFLLRHRHYDNLKHEHSREELEHAVDG